MTTWTDDGIARFVSRSVERVFHEPVEVVCARTVDEVVPCLRHIEEAVSEGLHAAGFLAYEAGPAFDPALATHGPSELPLLRFGLYRRCSINFAERGALREDAYETGPWRSLVEKGEYLDAVAQIRELIAAGDTYQVNYTFPLEAAFRGDASAWFERLVAAQAADYCAYVDAGRYRVLSVSPELFFRLEGERLETRPMKGTRRRGRRLDEDRAAAAELVASEKERAENVMIVDLLRNDMGRISEVGSVEVPELFAVERYETVWQMVSGIVSRTYEGVPEILGALFPSGSVTGTPKIRTMQIIRELEPHPRGVYCGSIGWWSPGRLAEFSVAIRTVVVDAERGTARYAVGSGITWGSDAKDEYEECLAKAAVLSHRTEPFELLESILFDDGYFLLTEHLERLRDSAEYFGFRVDEARVRATLETYAGRLRSAGTPLKVRLLLSREGGVRLEHGAVGPAKTVRLGLAREPVDADNVFLYHKTTRREVYERALASRPDCDDVLLWNARGEITESCFANVVLDLEGELLTPAWGCGLLAGTMRRRLIEEGRIREAVLTREDVARARRVFLVNSVRKEIDAVLVDGG